MCTSTKSFAPQKTGIMKNYSLDQLYHKLINSAEHIAKLNDEVIVQYNNEREKVVRLRLQKHNNKFNFSNFIF